MKKQKVGKTLIKFVSAMICIMIVLTTCAFAGTSKSEFHVDVPKLGRSVLSDTQQTKTYTNRSGEIEFRFVGGGYKIDCRLNDLKNGDEGAWVKDCKSGTCKSLPSRASHQVGHKMKVRFDNKLTTFVDVNSYGKWRSDITG